ncbi:diaminopimelate decarboxylase [Alphaproteobacteria bacterium]|nr:diaminopimelate decarboxylase [Alphaproteobacteria bacterium]
MIKNSMDDFYYKNGELIVENTPISNIAKELKTPFYCYSSRRLKKNFNNLKNSLAGLNSTIYFAVKSNSNISIIKTLSDEGAGADVVSEGEIRKSIKAGISPNKIVFSGIGKTENEIAYAVKKNIFQINIESESELIKINNIANSLNKKVNIGIRVNPDINANTHKKISTGTAENKFGIGWLQAREVFNNAKNMNHLNINGIAIHIGSQLLDLSPLDKAFEKVREYIKILYEDGINIKNIDLGGGIGVSYSGEKSPSAEDYSRVVKNHFKDFNNHFMFEPGRYLIANAGVLVTKVIYIKNSESKKFVIVDAGMNDLLRPALYDSKHDIKPVVEDNYINNIKNAEIVGPICESSDTFSRHFEYTKLDENDLLAIMTTGAYGSVMSSYYNTRPLIPEVIVNQLNFTIIRKRPSYDEMFATENFASWQ